MKACQCFNTVYIIQSFGSVNLLKPAVYKNVAVTIFLFLIDPLDYIPHFP
jgi:hypothetical protein